MIPRIAIGLVMAALLPLVGGCDSGDEDIGRVVVDTLRESAGEDRWLGIYTDRCRVGRMHVTIEALEDGGVVLEQEYDMALGPVLKRGLHRVELDADGRLVLSREIIRSPEEEVDEVGFVYEARGEGCRFRMYGRKGEEERTFEDTTLERPVGALPQEFLFLVVPALVEAGLDGRMLHQRAEVHEVGFEPAVETMIVTPGGPLEVERIRGRIESEGDEFAFVFDLRDGRGIAYRGEDHRVVRILGSEAEVGRHLPVGETELEVRRVAASFLAALARGDRERVGALAPRLDVGRVILEFRASVGDGPERRLYADIEVEDLAHLLPTSIEGDGAEVEIMGYGALRLARTDGVWAPVSLSMD